MAEATTRKAPEKRREIGVRELVRLIQTATAAEDTATANREALIAMGRYMSGQPEVKAALAAHLRLHGGIVRPAQ